MNEFTKNQCDGCRAGLPLKNGIHYDEQQFGIACTAEEYFDMDEVYPLHEMERE